MTSRSFAEVELKERLKTHGYTLYGVTHFKKHDRIRFGNKKINISMNLRSKLSYLALDAIINACIGKEKESAESKEPEQDEYGVTQAEVNEIAKIIEKGDSAK